MRQKRDEGERMAERERSGGAYPRRRRGPTQSVGAERQETMTTTKERKLALFAWISVCLLWGTTYLAIRVSLETMPPLLMAGLRWTIAALLMFAWLIMRGERLPSRESWPGIMLLGFLMIVLGHGGVVWAEE